MGKREKIDSALTQLSECHVPLRTGLRKKLAHMQVKEAAPAMHQIH